MLPTTPVFFGFIIFVFFAFWLLRRLHAASVGAICAANLCFYACWGTVYVALIPAAATCDFFLGREMGRTQRRWLRRLLLLASLALNLGLIFSTKFKNVALPLGLSFYAFQALTWTLDIYRGDAKPAAGYLEYFASVTFFPTALAGPITRVASLVPQWNWKGVVLTGEEGSRALFLVALGLLKKFLIADYLGVNLVNRVFDLPTLYSGGDVLVAVYSYAFQLYYDFSGYSDIALGTALLLGIRLPANFNLPYRAANIADFWRRWHISFSNWLRDYLYFALPGPRTRFMPYLNLVITMALGGLWHGLGWNFLVWGLLHGLGLAVFRLWQTARRHRPAKSGRFGLLAGQFLTFHFVLVGWIFFRAGTLDVALKIFRQLASVTFTFDNVTPLFMAVLVIGAAGHFAPKTLFDSAVLLFARTPAPVQAVALLLVAVAIRFVASTGAAPFIYTKF